MSAENYNIAPHPPCFIVGQNPWVLFTLAVVHAAIDDRWAIDALFLTFLLWPSCCLQGLLSTPLFSFSMWTLSHLISSLFSSLVSGYKVSSFFTTSPIFGNAFTYFFFSPYCLIVAPFTKPFNLLFRFTTRWRH